MNTDFWLNIWREDDIPFHNPAPNEMLLKHFQYAATTVFVPLCGASVDMHWLVQQGHRVIGVELSKLALDVFIKQQALAGSWQRTPDFQKFDSDLYTLYAGDIFRLGARELATCQRVYDRAALAPTARDEGSFHQQIFRPIIEQAEKAGLVTWHEADQGVLIPELSLYFKCSHGHTPFLMHPYNEHFIYLADLIPSSHHVRLPWVMAYDIYPGRSVQDKEEFLGFIHDNKLTIIFEHDPDYWGGNVTRDAKKGWLLSETFPAASAKVIPASTGDFGLA